MEFDSVHLNGIAWWSWESRTSIYCKPTHRRKLNSGVENGLDMEIVNYMSSYRSENGGESA